MVFYQRLDCYQHRVLHEGKKKTLVYKISLNILVCRELIAWRTEKGERKKRKGKRIIVPKF